MRDCFCVTGCGRSGTTILQRLLNDDKRIFCGEELGIFIFPSLDDHWKRIVNLVNRDVDKERFNNEKAHFALKGLDIKEYAEICRRYRASTEKCLNLLNLYIDEVMGSVVLLGDKMPMEYIELGKEISEKYEKLKFIICTRDGRAIMASQIREHKKYMEGKARSTYWHSPDIKDAQKLWLSFMPKQREFMNAIDPDRILEIRYEQAVENPLQTRDRIYDFLNLKINNNVGDWNFYKPTHIKSWREELPSIQSCLDRDFKNLLKEWGYDD